MKSVSRNQTSDNAPRTRRIPIDPEVVRVAGSDAAILLAQLMYWSKRPHRDGDGWIYKTHAEWENETGLKRQQQRTARRRLQAMMPGAIEERYAGRFPRCLEFRLNPTVYDPAVGLNQPTEEPSSWLESTTQMVEINQQVVGSNQQAEGISAEAREGHEAIPPALDYSAITTKTTLSCDGSPSEPAEKEREGVLHQGEDGDEPGERIAIPASPSPTPSLAAMPNGATTPETNQRGAPPRSADPPARERTSPQAGALLDAWNDVVPEHMRETLSAPLGGLCKQALLAHDLDWWRETFGHVQRSAWLRGESKEAKWRNATLAWILAHAETVRKGQYDDKAPPAPSSAEVIAVMVHNGWQQDMAEAWFKEHGARLVAQVVANGGWSRCMLPGAPIVVPPQQ